MFKAIKDNKIIAVNTTNYFPCLVYDSIEEDIDRQVSDYKMIGTEYVLNSDDKAIEAKKSEVREIRNSYLEKYVDPKQLVLVWDSMSEEDKKEYTDYRQYLLDYPESSETWYENNPLTFDEWKAK